MKKPTDVNSYGQTFPQWYRAVNARVLARAGLGIDDLADGPSWDAWADDTPAAEYADERLEEEGFPG